MNMAGIVAVATGAVLGAWLRWGLSAWLNPAYPNLPLGTLAANIGGGYAVGLAAAFFPPTPRLHRSGGSPALPDSLVR